MADDKKDLVIEPGTEAWTEQVNQFITQIRSLDEARAKATEIAVQMQTYSDQYQALLADYTAKIATLEAAGYTAYANEAKMQRDNALSDLSEKAVRETDFWNKLSAGAGAYTKKELKVIVGEIDNVIKYINGNKNVKLPFELDPEMLASLKTGSKMFKDLTASSKEFSGSLKGKKLFGDFGKTVKEGFGKGIFPGLKSLFSASGELVKKFSGPAKAIIGVVKGVMSVVKMGIEAEKRHQAALKALREAWRSENVQYELLRMDANLKYEEGNNIFGTNEIGRATNALKVYRQAIAGYKKEMQGDKPYLPSGWFGELWSQSSHYKQQLADYNAGILALKNIQIVTGHEKTGFLGWGKGKDTYSGILSVYPDLIDGENNLNVERAKSILATQKMSDVNKKLLQDLVDLSEKGDAALAELRTALQATYGELGDGILNALVGAFKTGTNAAEAFGKSVGNVLEKLGSQIVYTLFFQKEFDKLQKDLEEIYSQEGVSEEEIANQSFDLVDRFYENVSKRMPDAERWMQRWKDKASDSGFDLWSPEEKDEDKQASGLRGEISEKITENTASKLEGLFRLSVDLQTRMANVGSEQLTVAQSSLVQVADVARSNIAIEENTRRTADNTDGLRERLDTVATELRAIKNNTASKEVWAK